MTRKNLIIALVVVAILVVGSLFIHASNDTKAPDHKIQVVAAENFWGSLVGQLGGNRIQVTSVVSDPNADPHEYESNATTARDFAAAKYIVLNGVGYDTWANKLIGAQPEPGRKVLTIGTLVGKKEGDNPHLWYNPAYVNVAIVQMDKDLISIDPSGRSYYQQQLKNLQVSLAGYQNRIKSIKQQYGGSKVAATEDIFAYLAQAAGLNLVSPQAFIEAVAEGNDPPANSIVQFQQQLESGQIKVLAYNEQTVTPLTTSIKQLAAQQNIPVIGITETIQPPDTSFQVWMNAQLINLQNALNANVLGQ
ncbi:MAG: zinc ABC transporter substrate-binding protein [Candidatus Saccharibacteria bacterium]